MLGISEARSGSLITPGQGDLTRPVTVSLAHRAVGLQATETGYENQAKRSASLSSQMPGTDDT